MAWTEEELSAAYDAQNAGASNSSGGMPWSIEDLSSAYDQQRLAESSTIGNFASGLARTPLSLGASVADVVSYPFRYGASYIPGLYDEAQKQKAREFFPFTQEMQATTLPKLGLERKDSFAQRLGEYISPIGFSNLAVQAVTGSGAGTGAYLANQFAPDSALAEIGGALAGGSAPLVGAKLISKYAPSIAGQAMSSAIGARPGDFAKSLKYKGAAEDVLGETSSKLKIAIQDASDMEVFKGAKDPVSLYNKNTAALNSIEDNLTELLGQADNVAPDVTIPKYPLTEKFINRAPKAEQRHLMDAFEEIKTAQNLGLDGSLGALQAEKRALYSRTYGETGAAKETLNKYIAADLKNTIENTVDSLAESKLIPQTLKGQVKELNKKSGTLLQIRPILERQVGYEEGKAPLDWLVKALRTSGGTLTTPTLIGSAIGGTALGPIGLAGGALLGAATSRAGKLGIASALKKAEPLASRISANIPRSMAEIAIKGTPKSLPKLPIDKAKQEEEQFPYNQSNDKSFINQLMDKAEQKLSTPKLLAGNRSDEDKELEPLIKAVISQESAGKPKAVSPKGATGLMQIMPATGKEIAQELGVKKYDLTDPETNKRFGAHYLKKMLVLFDYDVELALAAYNAGPNKVKQWMKQYGDSWLAIAKALKQKGHYIETVKYVPSVLRKFDKITMV